MLRVFKVRVVDLSRSLPCGSLLTEFRGVADPSVWSHLPRGGTQAPGPLEPRMAVSKMRRNQENPELWVQVLPQLLCGVAECGPGARPGPSTGGVSALGLGVGVGLPVPRSAPVWPALWLWERELCDLRAFPTQSQPNTGRATSVKSFPSGPRYLSMVLVGPCLLI